MNKTEFPLGVELPLRGGGVAVLYEFLDGYWWGRFMKAGLPRWKFGMWGPSGAAASYVASSDLDILPPKRKAWVVWFKNHPPQIVTRRPEQAWIEMDEGGEIGVVQEITEP